MAAQAARRKKCSPQLLRVIVDGVEVASLNLNQEQLLQLAVHNNAELIDLKTADAQGELVLLTHFIKHNENREPLEALDYRLALQGRRELAIGLSNLSDDADHMTLTVSYRRNARTLLPLHLLRLLGRTLLTFRPQADWRVATGLLAVLALAVLGLMLLGIKSYLFQGKHEETPLQAKNEPQIVPNPVELAKAAKGNRKDDGVVPPKATPSPQGSRLPQSEATLSASERTRTITPRGTGATLAEVKKIFVEPLGDQSTGQAIVRLLQEHLRTIERFALAETLDQADAVLKVTAEQKSASGEKASATRRSVKAQLINANGDVLWPLSHNRRSASYSGSQTESPRQS